MQIESIQSPEQVIPEFDAIANELCRSNSNWTSNDRKYRSLFANELRDYDFEGGFKSDTIDLDTGARVALDPQFMHVELSLWDSEFIAQGESDTILGFDPVTGHPIADPGGHRLRNLPKLIDAGLTEIFGRYRYNRTDTGKVYDDGQYGQITLIFDEDGGLGEFFALDGQKDDRNYTMAIVEIHCKVRDRFHIYALRDVYEWILDTMHSGAIA